LLALTWTFGPDDLTSDILKHLDGFYSRLELL